MQLSPHGDFGSTGGHFHVLDDDALDELLDVAEKDLLVALYDAWSQQPEKFVFPPMGLDTPALSQGPPSNTRIVPAMAHLRALAEANLIDLSMPPPRTRKGSAPGGNVNSTLTGRRYYAHLKARADRDEHASRSDSTQAQAFAKRQDVTLPGVDLREQLATSRQQWDFIGSQSPSGHAGPTSSPDTGQPPGGSSAQPVDFVSWCGKVLRVLLTMQESSTDVADFGVRFDALAQAIFHPSGDATTAISRTRYQALTDAHRNLKALGVIEDLVGQRVRIPRQQYDKARDQIPLWHLICGQRLDPNEERILLALNHRSEVRSDDHAYLKSVAYDDLGSDVGLGNSNAIEQLLRNLQTFGLARRSGGLGDLSASATYSGLAWETRRWVLTEDDTTAGDVMRVDPIWPGRNFPVDERLCFVLMPFKDPFTTIFEEHIKPTVEGLSLDCRKADDIYGVGPIMEDIWEQLCRSRIVIADLTGRNPNVFYEVGIAHTLGKPVIMLVQAMDDVPFDLKHHRVIPYTYTPPGARMLEMKISQTIQSILAT